MQPDVLLLVHYLLNYFVRSCALTSAPTSATSSELLGEHSNSPSFASLHRSQNARFGAPSYVPSGLPAIVLSNAPASAPRSAM